jgi:hypothetical protein
MTAMSNKEFAEAVMGLGQPQEEFKASVTYIPEGDCLECVFAPDDYYGERIDGLVTVYYSRETGQIVGSLVKGFDAFCRRILKDFPSVMIVIQDGTVKLEHMFLAYILGMGARYDTSLALTYQKLIEKAEESELRAPLECVSL